MQSRLEHMQSRLEQLSRYMVWAGGAALIALAGIVTLEVVLRGLGLLRINVGVELSGYVLAISTSWAFAYALFQKAHVRVDAVIQLLPRRVAAFVDVVAVLSLLWLGAVYVRHGWTVLGFSWQQGSRAMTQLGTPLWIPQAFWVFGLAVFAVCAAWLFMCSLVSLLWGEVRAVETLVGTDTRDQQAQEEIGAAMDETAQKPAER